MPIAIGLLALAAFALTTDLGVTALAIAVEDAQHNLGYPRTINLPTLSFDLLHPGRQQSFTVVSAGTERVKGGVPAGGRMLALASSPQAGQNRQPTAEGVLTTLDRYFEAYRLALGELVAEERMVQQTGGRQLDSPNAVKSIAITREIISDVAFIDLPGGAGWLGFRDTKKVSGKVQPRTGPSLVEALTLGGASGPEQALALLQASAKRNLGEPRTTNLPNLPLELLHQRNRARYRIFVEDFDRVEGHETALVQLEETRTPTIIQRPQGGDIFTVVRAWIETETGRLRRAHVRLVDARVKAGGIRASPVTVHVRFAEHPTLGLLVPDRMEEEFYAQGRGLGRSEARYTNYRRFSAGARIVPPESGR